jgi:hypothetical protein
MRGGNEEVMNSSSTTTVQPVVASAQPVVASVVASAQPVVASAQPVVASAQPSLTEKAKNVGRNAVDFIKGWFGVGTQSAGRKRRKNRRKTVRKH